MMEMFMWVMVLIAVIGLAVGLLFYLVNRFSKFRFLDKIEDATIYKDKERTTARGAEFGQSARKKYQEEHGKDAKYKPKRSWLRIFLSLLLVVLIFVIVLLITSGTEAIIVLIHAGIFWAISEGIFALIRVVFKVDLTNRSVYIPGIVAIIATIVYMLVAFYLCATVFVTNYTIDTNKNVEPLRIVQFADSHLGITMTADTFPAEVEKIKAQNPDIVLITGDYVDDNSSREDLDACSKALSTINCKYGVYFSYGNHDRGYYDDSHRGYNVEYLINSLESNGVKVLEDEVVNLDNQYLLIVRDDKSDRNRMTIQQLVTGIDANQFNSEYSIVMDHQPNDYDAEAKANVDLVLSGHTHGGQLLPINKVGEWVGVNDATYGYHKIGNTDFIVTSGISCWGLRFKTGTSSEIVVIDIK